MNSTENSADFSETRLLEITERLKPILEPLGYLFSLEQKADSSGGPFANGFFKKDGLQIGLIWRNLSGLGLVVYENGKFSVGHDEIMKYLNHSKIYKLSFDRNSWKTYSRDGSNIADALIFDMRLLVKDFLATDKMSINQTLEGAHKIRQRKFPWL